MEFINIRVEERENLFAITAVVVVAVSLVEGRSRGLKVEGYNGDKVPELFLEYNLNQ